MVQIGSIVRGFESYIASKTIYSSAQLNECKDKYSKIVFHNLGQYYRDHQTIKIEFHAQDGSGLATTGYTTKKSVEKYIKNQIITYAGMRSVGYSEEDINKAIEEGLQSKEGLDPQNIIHEFKEKARRESKTILEGYYLEECKKQNVKPNYLLVGTQLSIWSLQEGRTFNEDLEGLEKIIQKDKKDIEESKNNLLAEYRAECSKKGIKFDEDFAQQVLEPWQGEYEVWKPASEVSQAKWQQLEAKINWDFKSKQARRGIFDANY